MNHGHSLKQLCENSKVVENILANGIKPKPRCDPNNNGFAGAKPPRQPGGKAKKKNQKNSEAAELEQLNSNNRKFANGSIGVHHKNHNTNDQSIIKLNNKKNCHQNPHLKRCQQQNNAATGMKGDRKNVKNSNNNNNGKKNNQNVSVKNNKAEKKVAERKLQQNKIRRRNKKKLATTIHSTTVDEETTVRMSDYESFASDEVGSDEDDYDDVGLGIAKSHTFNFVNNNDAYEDNS